VFCPYSIREARREDLTSVVALWREMMAVHVALDDRFRFVADADAEFARHARRMMRGPVSRILVAVARRMMRGPVSRILVAVIGGQVVGYVLVELQQRPPIYPVGRYGFISDICVSGRHRRRGIGAALVQRAIGWLRSEGVNTVELLAADRNETARSFWAAMGFEPYLVMLRKGIGGLDPPRIGFRVDRLGRGAGG